MTQRAQEPHQHLGEGEREVTHLDDGVRCGARIAQNALERTKSTGALSLGGYGLEPVHHRPLAQRNDRGNVLMRIAVGVQEREHGIVAPIHSRNNGPSGTKINPKTHGSTLYLSIPTIPAYLHPRS